MDPQRCRLEDCRDLICADKRIEEELSDERYYLVHEAPYFDGRAFAMIFRWIIPMLALPGTMLIIIPGLLSWLAFDTDFASQQAYPGYWQFWAALILAVPGATMALWSGSLFFRFGEGTAAPWDPPQNLVLRGPYCHVRNPMLLGAILLLFAEAFFFRSWLIGGWATIFCAGNAVYFPFSEEPGLRKRFGREYEDYCKHVPRWIPQLRAWRPSSHDDAIVDFGSSFASGRDQGG